MDVCVARSIGLAMRPFDAVITQRLALATRRGIDEVVELCRARGAKFIYDIDDDLLGLESHHPDSTEYAGTGRVVRHALQCADQVWVSTAELARRYRLLARDVVVVPNSLDARVWKQPQAPSEDAAFRFVYMGTHSHKRDFEEILEPAFRRLHQQSSRPVSLHLIGVAPNGDGDRSWSSVALPPSSSIYPVFAHWLQASNRYDAGVAPLRDDHFNSAKSDIKWHEYSAMGLGTVAADLAPYRDTIRHGANGLLCGSDPDCWFEAMREMVEGGAEPMRSAAMAEIAARLRQSEELEPRIGLILALRAGPAS